MGSSFCDRSGLSNSERSEATLRRYVMVVDIVHLSTPVLQPRFLHGAEKGRSPQDAARVSYLCTLLPLWIGDLRSVKASFCNRDPSLRLSKCFFLLFRGSSSRVMS